MNKIEQRITDAWYQNKIWILILFPLELFYRLLINIRKLFYRIGLFKSRHPGVATVIVGNISVGGTGKTPVVIELVNFLSKKGWKPGVISRGYGGKQQNYPFLVDDNTHATQCGDEPILIHRNTQAMIAIDSLKSRGADYLVEQGCDIIIADDGLQHLALKRDYEIAVVDGSRGFGNQHCLPVGPLREPVSRLNSCDFILTNGDSDLAIQNLIQEKNSDNFIIEAEELIDINSKNSFPVSWLQSKEIHALAGIGNPQRFFSLLKKLGASIIEHAFPDHHEFKMADIPNDKKSLVVTEKDAVKLERFDLQDCFYLKIGTELPQKFLSNFDEFLTTYTQNKKVNK